MRNRVYLWRDSKKTKMGKLNREGEKKKSNGGEVRKGS